MGSLGLRTWGGGTCNLMQTQVGVREVTKDKQMGDVEFSQGHCD